MQYDEAFAFVESLYDHWERNRRWEKYLGWVSELNRQVQDFPHDINAAEVLKRIAIDSIALSDLYYVDPDANQLVVAGQKSMLKIIKDEMGKHDPWIDEDGRKRFTPTRKIAYWEEKTVPGPGILYLPKKARLPFALDLYKQKQEFGLDMLKGLPDTLWTETVAVQWTEVFSTVGDDGKPFPVNGNEGGTRWLMLITYVDAAGAGLGILPAGMYAWGDNLDHAIHMATAKPVLDVTTYLSSFWAFIQQKIIVQQLSGMPKSFKKRAERAARPTNGVKVVYLRKREYADTPVQDGDAAGVEWSHRWIVDAHWHRYHTKDGMIRKWLLPYQKGPEDKPLVVKDKRLFAVTQ